MEGYEKNEKNVIGTYTKIEDAFVDRYQIKEGESIEKAKERLKKRRDEKHLAFY